MNPSEKARSYPRPVPSFRPVARQSRKADGWSVKRQRAFIEALATTGSVNAAAKAAGMSDVFDTLLDHARDGIPEPVFHAGRKVGERRRFNHKTMVWIVDNKGRDKLNAAQQRAAEEAEMAAQAEHLREDIKKKLDTLHAQLMREHLTRLREIAEDPAQRAAFEVLKGPTDWDGVLGGTIDPDTITLTL